MPAAGREYVYAGRAGEVTKFCGFGMVAVSIDDIPGGESGAEIKIDAASLTFEPRKPRAS